MKTRTGLLTFLLPAMVFCLLQDAAGQHRSYGGDFLAELFAPLDHTHFSPLGTPYVHPFNFEPAQIHQDVFFIYRFAANTFEGADEHEAEAHVDWALTRRLGFVVGQPLIGIQNASGIHNAGLGDFEFAPRILFVDRDTFILTANVFMSFPTGDSARDLGAGEMVLSPYLTTWHDLGNWNTLSVNFGPDVAMQSGDVSFSYAFSLTHSWLGPQLLEGESHEQVHDEVEQHHFTPGMTSLYLEMTGETELTDARRTFIEIMPGISYVLVESAELRFGVLLPATGRKRFDAQYFTSFTWIY